jgi:cell pole-organizing protein PopZ
MGDMTREPSMEEILSSIRRVIARDEDALGAPDTTEMGDDGDDILELTAPEDVGAPAESGAIAVDSDAAITPDSLVSEISAQASRQSLDALSAALTVEPLESASKTSDASGDMTLNAIAEAMLRPMLKSWLDANLPPMVERLVAREIARITGNRF